MKNISLALVMILSLAACDQSSGWSDVSDVVERPAPKKYEKLCDFIVPLIERYCQKEAECGFVGADAGSQDECFHAFFDYYAVWRCEVDARLPDETYDACLAGFDSMQCSASGATLPLPDGCQVL